MPFVLFLIFTFTVAPLIIWGVMHEDMLIKLEDKIIEDIRSQFAENRRSKNIKVVKNEKADSLGVQRSNNAYSGYVA